MGRKVAANSSPVVLSTEDLAALVGPTLSDLTVTGSISALNANLATGVPTANSTIEAVVNGYNTIAVQVTGTFSATLVIQGTVDGTNWVTLGTRLQNPATTIIASGITTTGTILIGDVTGLYKVRVTASAYTSGTAVATLSLSTGAGSPSVIGFINTVSAITSANLGIPGTVADATSGTINTNTTTAAVTPTFGCSYEVNIPITSVTGTTPTLDVVIQESDDAGANWFDVYHFERITATGIYRSPKMPLTGNRVRYIQTVGGTSPSFVRLINRLQSSDTATPIRRFFDRTLNSAQALNATTGSVTMGNPSKNVQLIISAGAITTTAPAFKVQGSEDGGSSWYDLPGATLTAVASSAVQISVTNIRAPILRAIATTAGAGATLNYICIKTYE